MSEEAAAGVDATCKCSNLKYYDEEGEGNSGLGTSRFHRKIQYEFFTRGFRSGKTQKEIEGDIIDCCALFCERGEKLDSILRGRSAAEVEKIKKAIECYDLKENVHVSAPPEILNLFRVVFAFPFMACMAANQYSGCPFNNVYGDSVPKCIYKPFLAFLIPTTDEYKKLLWLYLKVMRIIGERVVGSTEKVVQGFLKLLKAAFNSDLVDNAQRVKAMVDLKLLNFDGTFTEELEEFMTAFGPLEPM